MLGAISSSLLPFAKRKGSRRATASASLASAQVLEGPAFLSPSLDNGLVGPSKAVAAVADYLDTFLEVLEGVKNEGSVDPYCEKLDAIGDCFSNSQLNVADNGVTPWESDKSTASMIYTAAECAKAVYTEIKVGDSYEKGGIHHCVRRIVDQSVSGGIKSMTFTATRISAAPGNPLKGDFCHVIAIKGSKRIVDHLVNLNCEPTVIGANEVLHPTVRFKSHKGFEGCAAALKSHVQTYLECLPPGSRVLFTGHSAGGAVAALLFTYLVTFPRSKHSRDGKLMNRDLKLSCVTFGAPPAFLPNPSTFLQSTKCPIGQVELTLTLVIEGDMVTRMDTEYVRFILKLWQDAARNPERRPKEDPRLGLPQAPVPASLWRNFGDIIVLRDEASDPSRGRDIKGYKVEDAIFRGLLYLNIAAHKMANYCEIAQCIAKGHSAVTNPP